MSLRETLTEWRQAGQRIALVPTMGALHAGHIALIEEARRRADRVVASIFINPMQFAAGEDLSRYPRREATDARALTAAKCDLLWLPPLEVMYPDGFATTINVGDIGDPLEGASRPGHFDGVATVVTKLFNQIHPDVAIFGEKDWQQLAVIRRLATDLNLAVEIVGFATQRDDDGLALSSRNAYLSPEERSAAVALPRALGIAARAIGRGGDEAEALATARESLTAAGFSVDYVAHADADSLGDAVPDRPSRLLAAARIGGARLIDNIAVDKQG
jgi:pantoate--beta-alanine ligase